MIADELVQRIRESANIAEIIGEHVKLKRMGGDYRGPCPFHMGKNPNFSVSMKTGTYHCFKCGVSGDVFTFVREKLGLDWPSAVKFVGERTGIEVIDTPRRDHVPDPNERNWEVLATAAEWYRTQLADETIGRTAREYLTSRGIDTEAAARFGLGFAPRDGASLAKFLHTLGFDESRLIEVGLFKLSDRDGKLFAHFRGRLMFPIVDEYGHHVGFGGRALGDDKPKYLNSAELSEFPNPVFQKRRTLYGMNAARNAMRRSQRALVVEGYMDVIRVALAGVEEVVAPLGTALTEEQAALLRRYARDVYLLYDKDVAGQKAMFKSGLELLRHKAVVHVVSLPPSAQNRPGDKVDPDSFVREHGREGLDRVLAQAVDIFDRQLQMTEKAIGFSDVEQRRNAIDKLLPTVRAAEDPLTREFYLSRLAEVSKVDKATLKAEADALPARSRSASRGAISGEHSANGDPGPASAEGGTTRASGAGSGPNDWASSLPSESQRGKGPWKGRQARTGPEWRASMVPPRRRTDEPAERALVMAMLADRGLVEVVAERHGPDDFRDSNFQRIFRVLLASDIDTGIDLIAESLDEETLGVLRGLLDREDGMGPEAVDVKLNLAKLDARLLEERLEEIRREIGQASPELQRELAREQMELSGELRRILPIRSPRGRQPK